MSKKPHRNQDQMLLTNKQLAACASSFHIAEAYHHWDREISDQLTRHLTGWAQEAIALRVQSSRR